MYMSQDQETLLHLAASRADIAVLINLLNAGALVDQPNEVRCFITCSIYFL